MEALCIHDLGPGQYTGTVEEEAQKNMQKVKGTLQFADSLGRSPKSGEDTKEGVQLLPAYAASEPRLLCVPIQAPGPSITEHMRLRSKFDKDWQEGPHLCVSELPHDLDEYLIKRDRGPTKPVGFLSKESFERTMRRILESDSRAPTKRKTSKTYTFSKSERM